MKITYDPRYNIGYIRLREKAAQVDTIHISDEMNVDMNPDGTIYGIELLNATEQLMGGLQGVLTFVNEASGKTGEIRITD